MAVAAALGAVHLSSCSSEPEGERGNWRGSRGDAAVRVIVERVRFEEDTQRVQSVGTARARLSADIFPESAGEVVAVSFSPGQLVQENDVLVRLESRAERLAVARAGVAVRDAEQLLDRYDRIDVEGAISDSQIDVARTALEATRIDLDLARNALEERVVRAPFTGFVGLTDIDPGARVTTQTMITRLDDRSSLFVDFSAPEQVFSGLSIGDEIRMEPFAQPGQSVTARIEAIDTGIDPATRNFTVRALVDNEEDRLRPGMSFRVEFELPGQSFPTLPEASILWGGEGAYVCRAQPGARAGTRRA